MQHPDNVYVKEEDLLPVIDQWLVKLFAPHRIGDTIRAMADNAAALAEPAPAADPAADVAAKIADCDAKLDKYRAALDAGVDAETVGGWIAAVKAERARANPQARLSEEVIKNLIQALGDIRAVIENAAPEAYAPGTKTIRAEMNLDPNNHGVIGSVRGGNCPITPRNASRFSSEISVEDASSRVLGDPVAVRSWARSHGLQVADRGRLSGAVIKAWQVAQS
ncbi:Lsr2 family DNA-binding protein [Catenulispora acidiphila]|uniref:Lsr2 family DNA-binding protein n=1 Tax=Catenulispora acidiphila TaxID=304895 RepID=UPI00019E3140|nr:Lsr2 family protein [Catenulispora acidiphila]